MKTYLRVFYLSLQDIMEYRMDFILTSFKYALTIMLMAMIWVAVDREHPGESFSFAQILNYFFWAAVLYGFTNFHTSYIETDIRTGQFSKFLTKPVKTLWYYFSFQSAKCLVEAGLKMLGLLPILWFFKVQLYASALTACLLLAFIVLSFTFAFFLFHTISSATIWLNEVYAIRYATMTIFRFLSGVLVPLQFLPPHIQHMLFYTPFPHAAFTPIQVLQNQVSLTYALQALGILSMWVVIMFLCNRWVCQKAAYAYEGVGI